jgi:hypothetical protein
MAFIEWFKWDAFIIGMVVSIVFTSLVLRR